MLENETLLDKAKQNLRIAKDLFNLNYSDDAYLSYIGYHLQQATELAIKHVLEIHSVEYRKNPNIENNLLLIKVNHINLSIPEYIDDHAEMLTSWEANTRYIKNFRLERRKVEKALPEIESFIKTIEKEFA